MVTLDGAHGEGGGQILRTALTLSLITGKPFELVNIRAGRKSPGLRPQHLAAVQLAARLSDAEISPVRVGSTILRFAPGALRVGDVDHRIGTAGATGLVLQTIHLPIAMHASERVEVRIVGGTFNEHAPSFPFLEWTWARYMRELGYRLELAMPTAGFYPKGGGELVVSISPGKPRARAIMLRGALARVHGTAIVCNLDNRGIAERMRDRAAEVVGRGGAPVQIEIERVSGVGQGAAIFLCAEFEPVDEQVPVRSTFVAIGELGRRAEAVGAEAANALLRDLNRAGAIDPFSADQLLIPLALADGGSQFRTTEITEHLRTNIHTVRSFVDRSIRVMEGEDGSGQVDIE